MPNQTQGEQWIREQLATLRESGFTPPAIAAFLVASQRRANEVRSQRPELARQAQTWMAAGALAYAPLPKRYLAWWAACAVMLDWHLGMVETPEGEPRKLGPADAMTLARAWLVPLAADDPTPALCAVAGATDVLDGRLARASQPTRAGRDLEGLVDFCFGVAALRGLRRTERIGRAVVAVETTRTTVGFAYALAEYFGRVQRPDDTFLHAARATTAVRTAGVIAAAGGRRRLGEALLAAGSVYALVSSSRRLPNGSSV